jgi:Flp pilus assembly protein TadG
MMERLRHFACLWTRLRRDEGGLALIEFAYSLPIMMSLGLVGIETTNYAIANLRVSQITSNLADTASRIGENTPLAVKQIRERDINDAFQAVRLQGQSINLTQRGRVILSSLEQNATGGQWIRWQRCVGMRSATSTYGNQNDGATGTSVTGMGPTGQKIQAPANSAVMFVEVVYQYQPIVSSAILGEPVISSYSAFLVRDRRDLSAGNDPVAQSGVTPSACTTYGA